MNTLADMPVAAPDLPTRERPSCRTGHPYARALWVALAMHAAVIFGWPQPERVREQAEFGVETAESSVEVALVAALPAEEPVAAVEPRAVEPPPPELPPMAEPMPPPEKMPEMMLSETEPMRPPVAVPPVSAKPKPPKESPPKPARVARAAGDGTSAIPGRDATTAQLSSGARSAKPGYLRNPHPAYPESARAAGQQGVVTLHVRVDAQGRVASARVTHSSGFAVLDERARGTVASQWTFKPATAGGVPVDSEVVIPIRFTLNR